MVQAKALGELLSAAQSERAFAGEALCATRDAFATHLDRLVVSRGNHRAAARDVFGTCLFVWVRDDEDGPGMMNRVLSAAADASPYDLIEYSEIDGNGGFIYVLTP
jgi:hypothetical protein